MKNYIASLLVAILSLSIFVGDIDARGRGGSFGGGRSFSSGSRSSSSSSSSSSWSSRPSSSSSRPSSSTAKATRVDNKVSGAVKSSNTFSSRQQAVNAFKAKNADATKPGGKYTSQYKSEPTKRPDHIPQTTTVGTSQVNVTYNGQYGGYGYMHPTLGTWMMYDMLSDAAMISAMSHREGYVVAPAGSTVVHSGVSFVWTILSIIIVCVVIIFIINVVVSMYNNERF